MLGTGNRRWRGGTGVPCSQHQPSAPAWGFWEIGGNTSKGVLLEERKFHVSGTLQRAGVSSAAWP